MRLCNTKQQKADGMCQILMEAVLLCILNTHTHMYIFLYIYIYILYIYMYAIQPDLRNAAMFDDLGGEELFVFSRDINKTIFTWSFITT